MEIINCIFCFTPKQRYIEVGLSQVYDCKVTNPQIIQKKWIKGKQKLLKHPLLPGYLFITSEQELELSTVRQINGVIKVLRYDYGASRLAPADEAFARWLLKYDGTLGMSKAIREGDHIKVVDGPLLDYAGTITRVNKQRQRAEVEFVFDNVTRRIWLGFDWVEDA
ncbi:MAG: transcription termination/antitermination NusG family protein [Clostridia bacterium]